MNSINKNSEDIIDNALESFPFFPIRLICLLGSIAGVFLFFYTIAHFSNIEDLWMILSSIILLLVFLPILLIQRRITVNITENTYREYSTYLGIKNGKWESFKGFTIITITPSQQMQRIGSRYGVNSIDVASTDFCLNLKKDNYNKLNIASGSFESMLEKAIVLAHRYKVGIMDCSEKPNKKYTYEEIIQKYPDPTI